MIQKVEKTSFRSIKSWIDGGLRENMTRDLEWGVKA